MVLTEVGQGLQWVVRPKPIPAAGQLRVRVSACAVCRTDLHLIDGELPAVKPPIVPGHEVVGRVEALGAHVRGFQLGQRVGIPWLGWTCGVCRYCSAGQENLCDRARFTGYQLDGGFAEHTLVDARFAIPLDALDAYSDAAAAPLLCAGLIGLRTLRMAGDAQNIGIYGFGAAGHIVAQVLRFERRPFFAFTRPGDREARRFALGLGAAWAGRSDEAPPEALDAALIFAPVGDLVVAALRATRKGGTVVCGGIHMSDIPSFPYRLLWGERTLRSVANLTRADGAAMCQTAAQTQIDTHPQRYPLRDANRALSDLRHGRLCGAAVLLP